MRNFIFVSLIAIASAADRSAASAERFEVELYPATTQELKRSYQETLTTQAKYANRHTPECDPNDDPRNHHLRTCFFRQPLPVLSAEGPWDTSWVPKDSHSGYDQAIASMEQLAKAGTLRNCERFHGETACERLVFAMPQEGITKAIARCRVAVVSKVEGAMEACEPIAMMTEGRVWLRVYVWYQFNPADIGRRDFSLGIVGPQTLNDQKVEAAVKSALRGPPLSLEMDDQSRGLVAVASGRVSPILHGLREKVTIRVDMESGWGNINIQRHEPGHYAATLEISSTLYVNSQNTTREVDWHLPVHDQQEHYAEVVKEQIRLSLQRLCRSQVWRAKILYCDVSPDTQTPEHR